MVQFTERNLPSCRGRCTSVAPHGGMRRTASATSGIGRGTLLSLSGMKSPFRRGGTSMTQTDFHATHWCHTGSRRPWTPPCSELPPAPLHPGLLPPSAGTAATRPE